MTNTPASATPVHLVNVTVKTEDGKIKVFRGEIEIGRIEKVYPSNSSPRARAFSRMEWKATSSRLVANRTIGSFDTRKEAVAAIAARITVGMGR